jgi:hypothetical protein
MRVDRKLAAAFLAVSVLVPVLASSEAAAQEQRPAAPLSFHVMTIS